MKVTAIISALFVAVALARKHHHCQCCVGDAIDSRISLSACNTWVQEHSNSHWDGGACTDRGHGRGIDGGDWEQMCRIAAANAKLDNWGSYRGCC